jgi:cation diffusion facilitator CzcD-associated flavoprotein CzcO
VTWPDFPYPAGTPLFPSHEHIHAYQRRYASHFHLAPHIYLNHTVLSTSWVGTSSHGHWNVTTKIRTDGSVFDKRFDHLIVAIGHNQYPYSPTWDGVEGWLDNTPPGCPKREILHSIYYRTPEPYRGRTVLVIGNGGSGADVAAQIAPLSKKVSLSRNPLSTN